MKKICFISLFFLFLISFTVNAHPGRTDDDGGHYDRSTGEYHYHHGYPAHQHPDGVCPYDYDDQTERNNSSSGNSSSTPNKLDTNLADKSDEQSELIKKPSKKMPIVIDIIAYIFIALLALCILSSFLSFILEAIHGIISRIKKNKNGRKQKQLLEDKAQNNYEYYFSCYAFYSPESFVDIPKGTYIKEGLPCSDDPGRYGIYTVYITPKGTRYHRKELCLRSPNIKQTNLAYVIKAYYPCARCVKKELDLSWYWEYKRIKEIKEKYNIP